jgi:Tol biopolymer transport system component
MIMKAMETSNTLRLSLILAFVGSLALVCSVSGDAQSGLTQFNDRPTFSAATSNITLIEFDDVAPRSGFTNYKAPNVFSTRGLQFQLGGGGRFGPGAISVVGGWYYAGPLYETTTGAKITWSPPNQPGNAYLEVRLPAEVTAIGADLWTVQPASGSVEVVLTASDGQTQSASVATAPRPAATFIGFTSLTPITSIRFSIPQGQTGLILDNFTFGQALTKRQSTSTSDSNSASASIKKPSAVPNRTVSTASADRPQQPNTTAAQRGTIAYIRNGTEIRLIEPDGSDDRRLWTHPDASKDLGIDSLAWRPDGQELAFSSSHTAVASLYHADLYGIRPDGSGFRKLTNPPDRGEYTRYPKGSVSVTVRNDQPIYKQSQASSGVFLVYVAGADEPQQITLPPGASKTLLFNNVADFGNHAQPIVAMWGRFRWFTPGLDVQAARTIKAPVFSITGDGIELLGAFRPVWRSDGSRVSYRSGFCTLSSVSVQPTAGEHSYDPMFGDKNPLGTCVWDWGPTPSTSNQIIYSENGSGSSIFRIAEGGKHPGEKLTAYSDIDYQLLFDLRWLPDASGLLFSNQTLMRDSANIFRYDFSTRKTTQITRLENEFTGNFSISPDGKWVVFERSKSLDDNRDIDLWIVGIDGRNARLLVRNAFSPSWR